MSGFGSSAWGSSPWGSLPTSGGGGTSGSPPVVTVVAPAVGSLDGPFTLASETPVVIDVTDADGDLALVIITVKMALQVQTDVIFDGAEFVWPYNTDASTRVAIENGYRFTFIPREGWGGDIEALRVFAVDATGLMEGATP